MIINNPRARAYKIFAGFIEQVYRITDGLKILELQAGRGNAVSYLPKDVSYLGVEEHGLTVSEAQRVGRPVIRAKVVDGAAYPGEQDVVICAELHKARQPKVLLRRMSEKVKPDGAALVYLNTDDVTKVTALCSPYFANVQVFPYSDYQQHWAVAVLTKSRADR